jgi:hypothetical protein
MVKLFYSNWYIIISVYEISTIGYKSISSLDSLKNFDIPS